MSTRCYPMVRGRRLRATQLDGCGNPVLSPGSVIVTKGFISVQLTANIEEGEEISVPNANGDICVLDTPCPKFRDYSVEASFCEVNPSLLSMMTGQPVVVNGDDIIGFDMDSDVSPCDSGFALELWTGVPSDACESGVAQYGYILLPFVRGGVLGDFTIENAAINFTMTGARTKKGSGWGVGPYNVIEIAGSNEVQTVTITGTPAGGNFKLTFDGEETANIAHNANAGAVQTALLALSNLATGDVVVTGGPGPGTPYIVTFGGEYAATNVPVMSASHTFTGGTSPDIAVTTTTQGSVTPAPLGQPVKVSTHLRTFVTSLAPPDEDCEPSELGTEADGAEQGSPGVFTPDNTYGPYDLAELQASSIDADPSGAWDEGTYVVLRDGSHAYWDGDSWESGEAP